MLCEPRKAHSATPARGKAAFLQHLRRASAPTLAARFSEKPGSLGAKLFSKSDPYLGAFQEAEVFRNLAASTDSEHFGKLGQELRGETASSGCSSREKSDTEKALSVSWLRAALNLPGLKPLHEPTGDYSHEWAEEDNVTAAAGAQPMDDSLLGHSNLSLNSKDLGLGPEFTKSTHGEGFFSKFSSAEQSWLDDFNPLSASPRKKKGKKKSNMCLQFGLNLLPLPHSSPGCTDKCTAMSTRIPEGKGKRGHWSCTGKGYQSFLHL